MDDTSADKYSPTQGPNINVNFGFTANSDQTQTSSDNASDNGKTFSGSDFNSGSSLVKAIIAIIGGVLTIGALIWFFVSLIISQSDIKTEIINTQNAVESFETNFNYHKDAVNNRFNQVDEKIEDIEDTLERDNIHP